MRRIASYIIAIFFLAAAVSPARADQLDERLPDLFMKLKAAGSSEESAGLQTKIWHIWIEGRDVETTKMLEQATKAMEIGAFEQAYAFLTALIAHAPDFAEGWNKRALLFYSIGALDFALRDIEQTLALEPRHFGAISGLGLIEAARGNDKAAIRAFERVLEIAPMNPNARLNIEYLKKHLAESQV